MAPSVETQSPSTAAVKTWTAAIVAVAEAIGSADWAETGAEPASVHRRSLQSVYAAVEATLQGQPLAGPLQPLEEADHAHPADPAILASSYERALDYGPRIDGGRYLLVPGAQRRKAAGSYFTPPPLVRLLIEATVLPVLGQRVRHAVFAAEDSDAWNIPPLAEWTAAQRQRAAETLLTMTICDPTCGPGCFLAAVVDALAERLALLRHWDNATGDVELAQCRSEIARSVVFGADSDPLCVSIARLSLWLRAGRPRDEPANAAPQFCVGDSLAGAEGSESTLFASERFQAEGPSMPIDWRASFPAVHASGGFDVVLGNPPFANAIEGLVAEATKQRLSRQFPELTGTADLAYYFLALADRIANARGAVGLVLPRAVLTSRSVRRLRERLLESRPPTLIYAPRDQYLFHGANVFVVLLALRRGGVCLGGWDGATENPRLAPIRVETENWWAPIVEEAGPEPNLRQVTLGERFEIFASMTAGMAYDVVPFLSDRPRDGALKFVTTGLIDPGACHWGVRVCRYLKKRFQRPCIHDDRAIPAYLQVRLEKVRRPKVLVAGLSNRVEAFLDRNGEFCGAVSTFTVLHPHDDLVELRAVCEYLNGAEVTRRLQLELGAQAMGGGRITLNKDFLRRLPCPQVALTPPPKNPY